MADTRIAGVSLGGILAIAGIVVAILLSLVFSGGFAKARWY
ncbi:MAG TPA: hypothetical protein VH816_17720 [Gaiellaceae bacterium]|jgi:hypothetical protein